MIMIGLPCFPRTFSWTFLRISFKLFVLMTFNFFEKKRFFSTIPFLVSFWSPCNSISLIRSLKDFYLFNHFFLLVICFDWWLPPLIFIKKFRDFYTVHFLEFFSLSFLRSPDIGKSRWCSDEKQVTIYSYRKWNILIVGPWTLGSWKLFEIL